MKEELKTIQLSLGDTFMYQAVEVTLGDAVEFISYTRIFDFFNEDRDIFHLWYWHSQGEQNKRAIYIPVTMKTLEQ